MVITECDAHRAAASTSYTFFRINIYGTLLICYRAHSAYGQRKTGFAIMLTYNIQHDVSISFILLPKSTQNPVHLFRIGIHDIGDSGDICGVFGQRDQVITFNVL